MRSLGLIAGFCLLAVANAGADDKVTTYVNLQPVANQDLTANFGSGRAGNNLASFPKGEQTFQGSKFKVEDRFIQLGSPLLREPKPESVKGIRVGKAFARLKILHSTFYGEGMMAVPDGTKIGRYKVNYEDGNSETVPIDYGKDVRDWWFTGVPKGVTRGKLAWEGDNEVAEATGFRLQVFVGTWENPHPEKKVVSIDYEKVAEDGVESPTAPFCLALSLEDK